MTTVLVVDDDPTVLELVTLVLESGGYQVHACDDPRRALDLVAHTAPACAVLDVSMPQVSGLEICRALRSGPDSADIPVILLTARGQWLDVSAGFDAGADDYMVKPFSPHDLLGRVQALLDPAHRASLR